MLSIALCDDQPEELDALTLAVNTYLARRDLSADARVCAFSHPDDLLTATASSRFHLYLLDIVMPMVDGIQVGRTLRRLDREAAIIFITSEPGFALEAYAANPINYLLKPVETGALYETLDLALSRIDYEEERTLAVKTREGLRVLPFSAIAWCEYRSHAVIYTLTTGEPVAGRSFRGRFDTAVAPLLADRRFVKTHASYVVNMAQVSLFARDAFTLRGGQVVPIAAKGYPAVRDAYMDFLMGDGPADGGTR